jgi:hypothetical protein
MIYFGSISAVGWMGFLFGAPVPSWFQGSPVINALILAYLWSARWAFLRKR